MSIQQMYNSLSKTASLRPYVLGGAAGLTLGGLYGLGDEKHNYYNELLHDSTSSRAGQGLMSGLAGAGGYKAMRGLGRGRLGSGLVGLLSTAGAAALTNPTLKENDPYRLPY